MRRSILSICLVLSACGETAVGNLASEADDMASEPAVVTPEARPVRIGELGAAFQACGAAGTPRNLKPGEALPVRPTPFDNAGESGSVSSTARFFICTRSLDQKWFGIVFDQGGTLAERCGVSEPVTRRRDYDGPCRSGWVQSAFVKVVAGEEPAPTTPAKAETVSGPASSAPPDG